ncbi:MAG: hypothetical protein J6A79_18745 [Clostridia bacterium]|nr:hypothetical protein [Clostridia bacterium]
MKETVLGMILCNVFAIAFGMFEAILPGFGVPGIVGIILFALGIIMAYWTGGAALALGMILADAVVFTLLIRLFAKSGIEGRIRQSKLHLEARDLESEEYKKPGITPGTIGIAITALRPSGVGEFEGKRTAVMSRGEFLNENDQIIVTEVIANTVYVSKSIENE